MSMKSDRNKDMILGAAGDALLRVCAAPDDNHEGAFTRLDADGWDWLARTACTQRIAPVLGRALRKADVDGRVPAAAADRIASVARWHALYALRQGAAIVDTLKLLRSEGFAPLVLKGGALAWRDYPDPVLRPMRDADLLLGREEAVAAQEMLLAHRAYRLVPHSVHYGPEHTHQLPPVQEIDRGLTIEIHHRLNAQGWAHEGQLLAMMRRANESINLLGIPARVPTAHVNLLHLIEHATLHHAFENGPLILSDVHYIAANHAIDWRKLETDATRMGLANGLYLIVALALQHGARWVPSSLARAATAAAPHLSAARMALLSDPETRSRHAMLRRLEREVGHQPGWTDGLMRALRPDNLQLARMSGFGSEQSLRWVGYPRWLVNRGVRFWSARRGEDTAPVVEKQLAMAEWLSAPDIADRGS
ncbi:MAG: nucleotidyltransferase family protein [Novosphingobium sp.]|nr:nucleotidyltransferase family protein [Novosphingobium sp.]